MLKADDQMEVYTVKGLLNGVYTVLRAIVLIILSPLLLVVAIFWLVFAWAYLVFWCGWRGGPE
jgi:hypothetical protein